MFNFHRIALLLIILALTMFDNVTWGQRNNEIYNLEAKWERTEANYKRDLEASKEKLRDLENKLREARQEERQLVAKGYTEQSSDFSLVQNPLVEVRKWIGILEESIAYEKGNIRRIEDLLNNGRQDLEFKKQQIKRRIDEEKRAKEEQERRRQEEQKKRDADLKKRKQQEKEMKEAAERQRKQEEARQRAEEERRRAEEARRRAEEERRRKEEERRRKYEMEYNREMARSEESFRRNIANADMQKQNMEYLRNEKIDNIEIKSGYIPSSGNSTMTAQKRSKEGILPSKNKSRNSDGMVLNAIPITQTDPQSSWDDNPFKDGMLKLEKKEFNGDGEYVAQQTQSAIGAIWEKFDDFMLSYEYSEYGDMTYKDDNLLMYTIRSTYTDIRNSTIDFWERHDVTDKIANTFQGIKNFAIDPIETVQNARENLKEKSLDYIKENAFSPVKVLTPNYAKSVDRAQDILNYEREILKGTKLLLEPQKLMRAVDDPKEWFREQERFNSKTLKKTSELAGNTAESVGLINVHKAMKHVYDAPTNKEEATSYVHKQVSKKAKKQAKEIGVKAFKKALPDDLVKNLNFYLDK